MEPAGMKEGDMRETDRPPLTRERILRAAIALADREGISALSMRRLGGLLDVEAMSLYKHVPNKDAMLRGMAGMLLAELPLPVQDGRWEDRLRALAHAYRALALAHPRLFAVVVDYALEAPEALPPVEAALGILWSAGFDELTTVRAFYLITSYVEGYALSEIAGMTGRSPLSSTPAGVSATGPSSSGSERFPHLTALRGTFATHGRQGTFEFGLDALLAGLRLVAAPTSADE
jgi:AcrR family transcriptional regulator